jgi:outer membrane protein OmpA-like peptidoglycan-associated protein
MIALFVAMFTMNAQTVEHSKLFDNVSVTVLGGGTTTGQFMDVPTPFFWDGTKAVVNGVRPFMGVEFTKYITPAVGVSLEGLGFVNTTTSYTFFDESAVLANGKLNLSNWLGGYKGQPRRVEVVAVAGLGWGHDYTGTNQTVSSMPKEDCEVVNAVNPYNSNAVLLTDRNYVVYNTGAELNVNLGKERAWQVNVRPGVFWFNKYTAGNFQSLPTWKHDARAYAQVGLTYKFGKSGHHNFRLCPYSVTKADYDALQAKYDELANRAPVTKEVVRETIRTERVTEVRETPTYFGKTYITFAIGSVALTDVERAKLEAFAKNITPETQVNIVGSADSKTGTETRNFALAHNRANVVKNVLINEFGIEADRISVDSRVDATENDLTSRSAILTLSVE